MKKTMKFKNLKSTISSYTLYRSLIVEGSKLVALDSENFPAILMKFAWKISELILHRDRKVTSKLRVFYRFGSYLVFLQKKHGSLFVVKYLKAALLSIQRAIAGTPVKSLREIEPDLPLPRLSTSGLPNIIGTRDRRAILSKSLSVVQFYLTLFSLYRVISAPVKAKISTITDSYKGSEDFIVGSLGFFRNDFWKLIRSQPFNLKGKKGRQVGLLPLQTSSSTNSVFSWWGWAYDAWLIRRHPTQFTLISEWLRVSGNSELERLLGVSTMPLNVSKVSVTWRDRKTNKIYSSSQLASLLNTNGDDVFSTRIGFKFENSALAKSYEKITSDPFPMGMKGLRPDPYLGRLSFKEEAAGKLRVFAMVDSWTQSIFKPLHDSIFSLLKSFPNDATFNQGEAFQRALSKAEKYGHSYGFDLSAATDRLPLSIQIQLLSGKIGDYLGSLWGFILTAREYRIPRNKYELDPGVLFYSVGQPMGALSSWGMLALSHHAIVQYCNRLIGNNSWTEAYEVLGDDIVIFDPSLASKYVEVMTLYGVELNMAKSVISHASPPTVEFAKRTSLKGEDVSPLSFRMFLNQDTFKGRLSIFAWWSTRIKDYFIPSFRTIMKRTRRTIKKLPLDQFALLGLISLAISSGKIPYDWLLREMRNSRSTLMKKGRLTLVNFPSKWAIDVSLRLLRRLPVDDLEPRWSHSYMFESTWYKAYLVRRIQKICKSFSIEDRWRFKLTILLRLGLIDSIPKYPKEEEPVIESSYSFSTKRDLSYDPNLTGLDRAEDFIRRNNIPGYNLDDFEKEEPVIPRLTGPGLFSWDCWIRKLDDNLANPFLTMSFYSSVSLSKYSLGLLLKWLDEVESAASDLRPFLVKERGSSIVKDAFKYLQFIEKSIKSGFRDDPFNQKLALESSWVFFDGPRDEKSQTGGGSSGYIPPKTRTLQSDLSEFPVPNKSSLASRFNNVKLSSTERMSGRPSVNWLTDGPQKPLDLAVPVSDSVQVSKFGAALPPSYETKNRRDTVRVTSSKASQGVLHLWWLRLTSNRRSFSFYLRRTWLFLSNPRNWYDFLIGGLISIVLICIILSFFL